MEELLLTTESRPDEQKGTRHSRRLRKEGRIPGVVYGHEEKPTSVLVDYRNLRSVLTTDAGLNAIIALEISGKRKMSIVKELQRHPISQDVLHVDFLLIDPDEEVTVEVPVNLTGTAKKVEQQQGIVDQILFELTVFAKPDAIPNQLEFDISELEVGESVTVGDLVFPPGSKPQLDPETPVAVAELTRMALVEEVPAEDEEGEEGEEVEGEEAAEGEEKEGAKDEAGGEKDAGGAKDSAGSDGGGGKSGGDSDSGGSS